MTVAQVNQHYVNRESARLLRAAKQVPAPDSVWVLQLLRWSLESGQCRPVPKYREALVGTLDNLEAVSAQNPEAAFQFLMKPADDEDPEAVRNLRYLKEQEDPVEAAGELWQELHTKLGATLAGYHGM